MKLSLMLGLIGLLLTPGWVDAQDVQDPLPSWNNFAAKQSIVAFVEKVTKEGSADFVPANERIATFDTAAGSGPRFCLYVHHTDAQREWAYDRDSSIARLDKGLEVAKANGWTVVDMKDD